MLKDTKVYNVSTKSKLNTFNIHHSGGFETIVNVGFILELFCDLRLFMMVTLIVNR